MLFLSRLGYPNRTVISINDETDVPEFAFTESQYTVRENNGSLSVTVRRYGDVSSQQTVSCITLSGSAAEGQDFVPRQSDSVIFDITFGPG